MPRRLPTDLARAGAMTTANSTGVSRGTTISRGVWALRANRRRARVARAPNRRARDGDGRTIVLGTRGAVVTAVMGSPCLRGSGGDAAAGEPEVHVIERRGSGADAGGGQTEVGDGRDRL